MPFLLFSGVRRTAGLGLLAYALLLTLGLSGVVLAKRKKAPAGRGFFVFRHTFERL